jgi:AraC family transcriptional regulator
MERRAAVVPTKEPRMSPDGSPRSPALPLRSLWLDRGANASVAVADLPNPGVGFVAASRSASVAVDEGIGAFWLVLRGAAHVTSREGRFWLRAGEWIAFARDAHPAVVVDRTTLALAVLAPMPLANPFALDAPGLPLVFPGRDRIAPRARHGVLRLWREAATRSAASEDLLSRLGYVLAGAQEDVTARLARCPGRTLARRQQVLARMQRAALYLDGHHDAPVRLEELARITSFSPRHFTKTFAQIHDCVPREMTSQVRLRAAADLLAMTALSIGEVGSRCGYQNACSFSRAFADYHGASPSSFRHRQHDASSQFRQNLWTHEATRRASIR